jgi:chemotaxis methyl-accepting protein methylase
MVATDTDRTLERAQKGIYPESSLIDLPKELIHLAFIRSGSPTYQKNL